MTTIDNEIIINAPIDEIWDALANLEEIEKYDPSAKKSTALTEAKSGLGSKRKVEMMDGKNWFEEKVTVFEPNKLLTFELTDCSFPVEKLKYTYSIEQIGSQVKVKQVMEYQIKFGFLGKILDTLMIKRQSDNTTKKFFVGLKSFTEKK